MARYNAKKNGQDGIATHVCVVCMKREVKYRGATCRRCQRRKDKRLAYQKERQERIANGKVVCCRCGKQKEISSRLLCPTCIASDSEPIQVRCHVCGMWFETFHIDTVCCSDECKQRRWRRLQLLSLYRSRRTVAFPVSHDQIQQIETVVYGLYRRNRLVYIGITCKYSTRIADHKKNKVFDRAVILQRFQTRRAAKREETRLIRRLAPVYNKQENVVYMEQCRQNQGADVIGVSMRTDST